MDVKDNKIERNYTIKCRDKLIPLNDLKIMGILNVTPDSFYSKSRKVKIDDLLLSADGMIKAGADFLDVGGCSTRPGAEIVDESTELERVIPAIVSLRKEFPQVLISVDTFRSSVAEKAIENGADIINDVTGGRFDESIFDVAARKKAPYILMHSRGDSKSMRSLTDYNNVVRDIVNELSEKVSILRNKGVNDIIIDPGFGFAKSMEQNYELLNSLELFQTLDCPLLVGVSRKGMIYKKLKISQEEALNGTTIINTVAAIKGADILRVHDVKEAKEIAYLLNDCVLKA